MADYQEVMKQYHRMCATVHDCEKCPLSFHNNNIGAGCKSALITYPARAEVIVMDWASENPEPIYPSWKEMWAILFPTSYATKNGWNCPCPKHFLDPDDIPHCETTKCHTCRNMPIPKYIADKLGIKPINQ